ncbi:MAG: leucine--tRNA ligase [Halobacteriaceae archaeon]
MDYEPRAIETEWQARWREEGRYEPDPGGDDAPTFVTVPYPYPSGGMHIGHARTYTVPDVYARYRRLQGDNVLFPLAWHVTGTPIVGAVERLKNDEPQQLSVLRDTYEVPEADLASLETPMGFARYFIENYYKTNMRSLGLSIDWRREFTTNDDRYSKFIAWQYEKLKERGLLERGLHPVKYCTNEEQPVTTHDLLEGEDAEYQEYTLVQFDWTHEGKGVTVPMATLRPETVRGVTNAFIDPEGTYAIASVDGERWFTSMAAVEKLRLQDRTVTVETELPGTTLVGESVRNPVTEETVPVLPASFVDPDNATGVVMSVPAHSPDDYVALQGLKDEPAQLRDAGVPASTIEAIEPTPILTIEGYGEIPARDAVQAAGIEDPDDPALEDVTADLYQAEFHRGRLIEAYGEFAGETVEAVRDRFRDHYQETGAFDAMYEFSEEVVCRCGADVEVARQETWFLRYNDPEWQAKAREAVDQLEAIPENTREQYEHTVDWLEEWPCIRNYGLGTRLPWDDEYVIEPLSDSTIYMAYYTIEPHIRDVPVEALDREFFDAVFYGPEAVEDPHPAALEAREEWQYWYPVDFRCSGNDLISNHLTFYLYHHAELFDQGAWPQGVTVMGMGLLEGEAMSSSSGHVVLPTEAIETHGADTVRFFLLNSAEPWQDYDWRDDEVATTRDQLEEFWGRAVDIIDTEAPETRPTLAPIDRWLLSRLQSVIEEVTEALDQFETRRASQAAFYRFADDLRWYRRRTDLERAGARWTRREVLRARLRLLAPFVPFLTNELHERLTGTPAEDADWPTVDPEYVDPQAEVEEELVEELLADIREVIDVTGTDPEEIAIYTAAPWKRTVLETMIEAGIEDRGGIMSAVMTDETLRERGEAVNDIVDELMDQLRERDREMRSAVADIDEAALYQRVASFIEREIGASVSVVAETAADDERAERAVPLRPAISID